MMSAADVLDLLDDLSSRGVTAWLDGGWGVDALLGEQTREHDDADLVVVREDLDTVRALLEAQGFVVERDWLPMAIALRHPDGRAVDLHPVDPTADGGGDQVVLPERQLSLRPTRHRDRRGPPGAVLLGRDTGGDPPGVRPGRGRPCRHGSPGRALRDQLARLNELRYRGASRVSDSARTRHLTVVE